MNFCKAMQHAFIGYGIRRKEWRPDSAMLYWHDSKEELRWVGSDIKWTPSTTELNDDFYHNDWEVT